jgi:hypothetical protein
LIEPTPVEFGQVVVGKSRDLPVTVVNSGTEPLAVSPGGVAATGAGFQVASDPVSGTSIPPKRAASVTVRLTPTGKGDLKGKLLVHTELGVFSADLTGTGL